ncbi:hypothetical protein ACIA5C_46095 [Actinoplanes sp. NPDC051343]|uniref:hypothetical protein n=1 Tax=Actinoplanes sp. NPDC051343 TaxID=3363906 RepID=UPI00379805D5
MRRGFAAASAALLAAAAGCGPHPPAADLTGEYHEAGVTVTLLLHSGSLTATYRPAQAGFHLYSTALPPGGIDGLGRPTVLAPGHGLTATGRAVADREPITLHEVELDVDLPVYPDGPITLTLPVGVSRAPFEAVIGYAACSATTCLFPVTDKIVTLQTSGG